MGRPSSASRAKWLGITAVLALAAFALGVGISGDRTDGGEDAVDVPSEGDLVETSQTSGSDVDPVAPAVTEAPLPRGAEEGTTSNRAFLATFDGDPLSPTPWNPANWDVTVHSRDPSTWDALETVDAAHGPGCEPPPATHEVTEYEAAVYQCKSHMMTSIRAGGYGLIYLTPNQMVDFSEGEAVITVDVSTLRTSVRDWWDIWISPYDDSLQLALDLDASADLTGPPRNGMLVALGTENQITAKIYDDFEIVEFPGWPESRVTGDTWTGYETFLEPDAKRRDTFEIRISRTSLKVGMPDYDFWWIDTEIPDLGWDTGVVQFGHHSYNPTKNCNEANNPRPWVEECAPNTWHWDNVTISPAAPFTIVQTDQRTAHSESPSMTLASPAPADGMLRFAGIGFELKVRFDGGPWVDAEVQATQEPTEEEHFASYWMPIPEGTQSIEFDGLNWYDGSWYVRDASVWSRSPTS